jgi:hypothetical protein
VVAPISATSANLVAAQSANITGVQEVEPGVYCVTPAPPINAEADTASVSPEVSYSSPEVPGVIALNARHTRCPASTFQVDTYAAAGETKPTGGHAFTIVIP